MRELHDSHGARRHASEAPAARAHDSPKHEAHDSLKLKMMLDPAAQKAEFFKYQKIVQEYRPVQGWSGPRAMRSLSRLLDLAVSRAPAWRRLEGCVRTAASRPRWLPLAQR